MNSNLLNQPSKPVQELPVQTVYFQNKLSFRSEDKCKNRVHKNTHFKVQVKLVNYCTKFRGANSAS